ncbi:NERD domain-containing protein (plasmid) [Kitasatospora sp. NBC_00070]|uniref:nuclease-related domain-containing protein n=1 Tax=Kitasatospora sp. NBC_00070 TaxID=2975962 RepID=UPI0032559C92
MAVGESGTGTGVTRMGLRQRAVERSGRHWRGLATLPATGAIGVLLWWWLGLIGLLLGIGLVATAVRHVHRRAASSWAPAAAGERRTARMLVPLQRDGWTVLHDRAVPGSKTNLDHLLISPNGVVLYVNTKTWSPARSQLRVGMDGELWYGQSSQARALQAVAGEARHAAATLGVPVQPFIAVHGAKVPFGYLELGGVTVLEARQLVFRLRSGSTLPAAAGVVPRQLADRAERLLPRTPRSRTGGQGHRNSGRAAVPPPNGDGRTAGSALPEHRTAALGIESG